MIILTVTNLSGVVKIFVMELVICGIRNTLHHPQNSFLFQLAGLLQKFLEYYLQSVHGVMLEKSNQIKDHLLAVTFLRRILLCIHLLALKKQELQKTLSNIDIKDASHSHSWNDKDHAFRYQLDRWGVERFFNISYEVIIRDLKSYV